jgi:hypothetical protein
MTSAEKFPTFSRMGRFLRRCALAIGRFLRRWFKPVFFTLVCFVTIIALFIAEENYRTGKAWEKYQADARARGEKLTFAELALPPVPDDQNFAMAPLIKPIFSAPMDASAKINLPSLSDLKDSKEHPPGEGGNWPLAQKADLTAWKTYLQPSDLLTAFKKLEPAMAEISTAIRRPYSRFPSPPYGSKPPSTTTLSVAQWARMTGVARDGTIIELSKLFKLRALAELDAGQSDRALDDAITSIRLAHALDSDLQMLSTLTEVAQFGIATQVVWEGLAANRWSERQLAALQRELENIDLFPKFQQSLQGEEVRYLVASELLKGQGFFALFKSYKNNFKLMTGEDPKFPTIFFSYVFLPAAMPVFGLNREQLESADYYENHVMPCINVSARTINPKASKASQDFAVQLSSQRNRWLHPQMLFEGSLKVSSDVLRSFAKCQTGLDEAIVACALERFKIEHGDYPANLNELVPQFIEKLPRDVVNGEPLHYQRTPDGRFMLYSVGWDMQDDHGVSVDYDKSDERGDWVWQYSPAKIWGR